MSGQYTMVVAGCRWITGDNLDTAVLSVVCSLALLAVVVSHVVGILLIKLQTATRCHLTQINIHTT